MDVTQGIIDKLADLFLGEGFTFYRNNQAQGFKEPSFYVQQISARNSKELSQRQRRRYPYALMYFPAEKNRQACELMAERLMEHFTVVNGYGHVYDVETQIIDDVLQFRFVLHLRVMTEAPAGTPMGTLEEATQLNV